VEASLPDNRLVGIDVGTSSVKAILIDEAGSLLADFAWPVAMSRPAAGYAEQNPTDWTDGIHAALTEVTVVSGAIWWLDVQYWLVWPK
jgi:xylulokinase